MDLKTVTFIELLSQQINNGSSKVTFENLSTHLNDAVNALPDNDLKKALLQHQTESSKKLWSFLKASKKQSGEIKFNLFTPKGKQETIKYILSIKSPKKRLYYLTQVGISSPSKEVFDMILKEKQVERPNESNLEVLVMVTELCSQQTVGCYDFKVLSEFMNFFLSEVGKIFEEFTTSNQPEESWLKLKDLISGFLMHCHLKYKRQKEKDEVAAYVTEFKDHLAAILSIYIDVVVKIANRNENNLNHISYLVSLLLSDSPSHILDTINQISTLDKTSIHYLHPFIRKVLSSTLTSCSDFINYIKYICVVMKVLECLDNKNDVLSVKKLAYTVFPDGDFSSWVSEKDKSLAQDFNLTDVSRDKITEHILKHGSEDIMDRLLDLTTEDKEEKQTTNINENMVEDETDSNVLFFVDSQGDTEMLEHLSEEEELLSSKKDKMLKKQIDAMLERLEPDSGSENECDGLNFDDETLDKMVTPQETEKNSETPIVSEELSEESVENEQNVGRKRKRKSQT